MDFKFSHGFAAKVVVEVKLTSNQQLEHRFTTQVDEYAKAEETDQRVYLVVDVEKLGSAERLAAFKTAAEALRSVKKRLPIVMHVNGRPKPPGQQVPPRRVSADKPRVSAGRYVRAGPRSAPGGSIPALVGQPAPGRRGPPAGSAHHVNRSSFG